VNENTPNSEVFVPSQSGGVLNVPQAQAALRGASGGGVAEVRVVGGELTLTDNGTIMAQVQVMDAQTVQKSVNASQRSFKNSKSGWSP